MEAILQQLGELLLKAVPTFLIVVFLHFYLKAIFFKPLEKVLHRRYEATEGARKSAAASLERAAAKTAEYEAALRAARSEMYKQQEQLNKQLQERHAAQLTEARQRAEVMVKAAKADLANETEAAKTRLTVDSEALANQITRSILGSAA
jgi:F-type H+-transporting ATPase subunit b